MAGISIGRAFYDLNQTPKKWMSILWMALCNLIPIVGPIVLMGYLFRRFARVRVLGNEEEEDFDIDIFIDYLWAGLPSFLASLVLGLLFIPVLLVMVFLMFAIMMGLANSGGGEAAATIAILVVCVGYFSAMLVLLLFVYPVQLQAGLRQQFGEGLRFGFIKRFIAKEGFSLLLWLFLLLLLAVPAFVVGYCALVVGAYVVSAVFQFISVHILFQHYDRFVAKGGEVIPIADALVYGKTVMENGGPNTPPSVPPSVPPSDA